jgi:hypothetical protein
MTFTDGSRSCLHTSRRERASARSASVVASLFMLSMGCSSVDNPQNLPECQGPVSVSVGSGPTPVFSWTPRCLAGQIIVGLPDGYANFWVATGSDNTNSLPTPIRYGTLPDSSSLRPHALAVGGDYRVVVLRASGDSAAPFQGIGTKEFTP